jgi:hypothetical protein
LEPFVTVTDSFAPEDGPDEFAVITQMRAVRVADSSCGDRWEVTADIDLYRDYKKRGGNSALDDLAGSVIAAIDAITGYFEVGLNSTSTNGLRVLDRTVYRRNVNYTFII